MFIRYYVLVKFDVIVAIKFFLPFTKVNTLNFESPIETPNFYTFKISFFYIDRYN